MLDFARVRLLLLKLVPIILGLGALALLETLDHVDPPPLIPEPTAPATRLWVFWLDSLSRNDVTAERMPALSARLAREGLHGPVHECADAVTVPCMLAAFHGVDRLSMFTLGRNFGAQSGALEGSVLDQLAKARRTAGYFGEQLLERPLQGLARIRIGQDDAEVWAQARTQLSRDDLSVIMVHLRDTDRAAHYYGGNGPRYKRVVAAADRQVSELVRELRPTDHWVVLGDHGHTRSGRHAAGLPATTYAAYFGPKFQRRLRRPLAITDHAALWAHALGFERAAPAWLRAYAAGEKVAPQRALPAVATQGSAPWWALLLSCVCACALVLGSARAEAAGGLLGAPSRLTAQATLLSLGALWAPLRAFLWRSSARLVGGTLLGHALPLLFTRPWAKGVAAPSLAERYERALLGAVLWSLPTVYWYGGVMVAQTWLSVGLVALLVAGFRKSVGARPWALVIALISLLALARVVISNHVLLGFWLFREMGPFTGLVTAGLFSAAAMLACSPTERRRCAAFVVFGLSLSAALSWAPPALGIVPCVLALPVTLAALSRPRLLGAACLLLPAALMAFWQGDLAQLGPVVATLVLWAALPVALAGQGAQLSALVVLALVWLSLWTSMACRISGVSFEFFFGWLPDESDVTKLWAPQALATVAKYLTPLAFGLLLALRRAPSLARSLERASSLAGVRLGLVLGFAAAFIAAYPGSGTFVLADVVEEGAFWVLWLALVWMVSWFVPQPAETA